jgi:hypothetical protein
MPKLPRASIVVYEEGTDRERTINIIEWDYTPFRKGVYFSAPEDCYPDEGPDLDNVQAEWADSGCALNDSEMEAYRDEIEKEIFEIEDAARAEPEWEPRERD